MPPATSEEVFTARSMSLRLVIYRITPTTLPLPETSGADTARTFSSVEARLPCQKLILPESSAFLISSEPGIEPAEMPVEAISTRPSVLTNCNSSESLSSKSSA